MIDAPRKGWVRRHGWVIATVCAIVALALDAGYQVYAARVSDRNAKAVATVKVIAPKVTRLTKGECGSTRFLYAFLNALALDSSPSFGSPPDGPVIPGARTKLINQLFAAERQSLPRLRKQGCKLKAPG